MKFMYGFLENNIPLGLPSDDYGSDKAFYKMFKQSISEAKSFNIYSFEQIGLFDPFPKELMESEFIIPIT